MTGPGKRAPDTERDFPRRADPWSVLLGAALWGYVWLRAWLVPLTFDEINALEYARPFKWERIADTAAIHLLNTRLTSWIMEAGGFSELMLRLPNVLAFLCYLWAAVDLGRLVRPGLATLQFILLATPPFLLDFFGLARGYGLGLGAMLPAIAFALRFLMTARGKWMAFSLVCGMLAVLANYTMLNFFLPLAAVLCWSTGQRYGWKARGWLMMAPTLVATVLFLAALLPILFALARGGQLYFGGRENLWSDTIGSLGRCLGYHTAYGKVASLVFQGASVTATAWALHCVIRSLRSGSVSASGLLSGLFLLGLLLPLVQNAALDTPLPVERTALLYLPMIGLLLVRAIGSLRERTGNAVAWCLGALCALHCAVTLNVASTYSWRFDSGGREVVDVIRKGFTGRVRLGINYEYAPAIWHYRGIHHYDELIVTNLSACWEYCIGLEELDPRYYGQRCERRGLDAADVRAFLRPGEFDLYYLDRFFLDAMDRSGIPYEVLLRHDRSRSALIRLTRPALVQRTPLPLAITSEGRTNTSVPLASSAINTMPWLSTPRIFRGSRLATSTTC